jgi:hypothetical protein
MRRLHLAVGLIALAAFLASGLYMRLGPDFVPALDDATRLLFRSSHIYLLFAALLNVVLGLYSEPAPGGWRLWLRRVGSVLVLIAPALLGLAFLREPWLTGLARPYAQPAVIGTFVGVLCHLASRTRPSSSPSCVASGKRGPEPDIGSSA